MTTAGSPLGSLRLLTVIYSSERYFCKLLKVGTKRRRRTAEILEDGVAAAMREQMTKELEVDQEPEGEASRTRKAQCFESVGGEHIDAVHQ